MSWNMAISNDAVKYILFQRTAYLMLARTMVFRKLNKLSPWPLYKFAVALESTVRRGKVKQLFNNDMNAEYEDIKAWLPKKCSRILDIGCGVGGIDVLLHKHYNCDSNMEFCLLDKTSIAEKIYYRFEEQGAFYNSLKVAEELLCSNGKNRKNIHLLNATEDCRIDAQPGIDLVISLLSWGFHYPISTYIDQVYDVTETGGCVIIDIRTGTGGEKELADKFSELQVISSTQKRLRVLAIK